MNIVSVDLGTTNSKAAVYNRSLQTLQIFSKAVSYNRKGDFVEFDAEAYFMDILALIQDAAAAGKKTNGEDTVQIVFTGQAESLVLLKENGQPAAPVISWLDMRSSEECEELKQHFSHELCYQTTGQPELIPTWPVTKILWLKRHRPDLFKSTARFLLLKDYLVYRLCGQLAGDYSIYSFSHYFDISRKCYWKEILDYCGVSDSQLPPPAPSGTIAGKLLPQHCGSGAGLTPETKINIGTLDHFAGMIGTGSISEGQVSESAGTVLSIAALTPAPVLAPGRLPNYCGPFPGSYVLLPVCESGGFSMEWYKAQFLDQISYTELNQILSERLTKSIPVFLPYLTGTNAPDYDTHASGVFFGIRAEHDKYDLALSVMAGVACLLKKNLDYMEECGVRIQKIISTGGGARSPVWTQMKANITGRAIEVPDNEEAPCLGAAIMAAVQEKYFSSYEEAIASCVAIKQRYEPSGDPAFQRTWKLFNSIYNGLQESFRI